MFKLIKLTYENGAPFYVNVHRIDGLGMYENDHTDVYVGGSDEPFKVKETPEQIVKVIEGKYDYSLHGPKRA